MYTLKLSSVTGSDPVTIGEVKAFLKITHSVEDQLLTDLISEVIRDMESYTGSSYRDAQYNLYVSDWRNGCIPIMQGPVSTISSVKYYDLDNALQTWDSGNYYVATGNPDYLMRKRDISLPSLYNRTDAVQIAFTTTADVDDRVKLRIKQAIGYFYERRNTHDRPTIGKIWGSLTAGLKLYRRVN